MTTTYQYAVKRARPANGQVGGISPAAVLGVLDTVNKVGKAVKPATRFGDFLESHVSDKSKKK